MLALTIKQTPLIPKANETNLQFVAKNLRRRGYIRRNETKNMCYRLSARIGELRRDYHWRIWSGDRTVNGFSDFVYILKKIGRVV